MAGQTPHVHVLFVFHAVEASPGLRGVLVMQHLFSLKGTTRAQVDVHLGDADDLVGLQAQAPLRMGQAILDRLAHVFSLSRAIHRLQKEMIER